MKATTKNVLLALITSLIFLGCAGKKKTESDEQPLDASSFAGFYAGVFENQAEWNTPIYLSIHSDGSYQMIVKEYGNHLTAKSLGIIAYTKGNQAFSVKASNGKNYTFKTDRAKLIEDGGAVLSLIDADAKTAKAITCLANYEAKALDPEKDKDMSFEVVYDDSNFCLQNVKVGDMENLEGFSLHENDITTDKNYLFTNENYTIEIDPINEWVKFYDNSKEKEKSNIYTAVILQPLSETYTAKDGDFEVNYFTGDKPAALVLNPDGQALFVTASEVWAKGAYYHNNVANYSLTINKHEATVNQDENSCIYRLK